MTKLSYYLVNSNELLYGASKEEVKKVCSHLHITVSDIMEFKYDEVKQKYKKSELDLARERSKKNWNHKQSTLDKNLRHRLVML